MWTPRGARPLAEPPVIYLDDIMQDIGSDRRYKNLWQNDPGKGSTMKDLVAEGSVIGKYDGWATEMSNDDPDIARREFYGQLMKNYLGVEGDAVCEEWRELSSTANPLGLIELLYIDNDGEITRIKALWEGGQVLRYEDDPAVQAVYGDVLDDYAIARFEKWQLDEDEGTKELERRLRAGEYVAGWT